MSARRIISGLLLPAYLSSCTAWHVQSVSPAQVVEDEQPSQIRVTTTSDSVVILQEPRVSGDTLIGFGERNFSWDGSVYGAPDTASEFKIPLADISHVELHKTDAAKSVLLGVGIVAGAFAALIAFALILCSVEGCFALGQPST